MRRGMCHSFLHVQSRSLIKSSAGRRKCHEIMRQSSCDNVWLSGADWVWERVGVSHGGDIPLWHAGTLSFGIVALQVLRVHRLTGHKSRDGRKSDA